MLAKPGNTREYLTSLTSEQRESLQQLRNAIVAAAPGAEEYFSYGMPAFRVNGKVLVWYAAWKQHLRKGIMKLRAGNLVALCAAMVIALPLPAQNRYVFGASGPNAAQLILAGSNLSSVTAYNEGSMGSDGVNYTDNFLTGYCTCGGPVRRSYFEFALPMFTGTVTSAKLRLHNNRYNSLSPTETFALFSLPVSLAGALESGAPSVALFDALGTGAPLGAVEVSDASNGVDVDVLLNSAFISAVNAHPDKLLMAGRLTSVDVVVAPEPATIMMTAVALLILGACRRRQVALL